ncbi:glycine cleavage system aminomethyltransferase GcvT [Flammeovirga sp. SJP92]|uniref:glycine cleavage system aminomethyltransferase GcvT n=1 Tax=Flammeovirga sp. SJP92 TaxID=1775430 RepID=UPI0007868EC9|nr:glycine cleavage system aminomethyltransferase GcvT [Flammeovirga sp. SJP92]KXX66954.1 glycine cleavage system protein T [Flammeovirga sp. SJP92]
MSDQQTLKKIALNDVHESLGAKMVPFAGYNMPVRYSSDLEEHKTVRNGVGVFDVSHMGEFFLKGPKALDLIQKVSSNDASKLFDGKAQYSCLPNEDGGIVDDLIIYKIKDEEYMLVVNASNIEKDWNWIAERNTEGVDMTNASDEISLFAVQGPKAAEAMQSLTDVNLSDMTFYTFEKGKFAGVDNVIISATGYTGAGGFELYVPNKDAEEVWKKIFEAGAAYDIKPIGLGARDTLRLEMGYCLYGNDIDDTTSPLEAGLGWVTKFTKEFTNSENLAKQKEEGVTRRLVGIELIDRGVPRGGYKVTTVDGEEIGHLTSGTMSPMLGKGVALGYINRPHTKAGTEVIIEVRNRKLKAVVSKLPFYKG